jgi:1,4-alpha-glucan branching enzyme
VVVQLPNGNAEFRFYRPQARHVSVVGDFSGWSQTGLPMTKGPDGWWRCQLRIAPGCYHFRYLCDDEWFIDYAAFGLDYGPGGLNSVVNIDSPPPLTANPAPMSRRITRSSQSPSNSSRRDAALRVRRVDRLHPRRDRTPLALEG